jgi:hypothetical protein
MHHYDGQGGSWLPVPDLRVAGLRVSDHRRPVQQRARTCRVHIVGKPSRTVCHAHLYRYPVAVVSAGSSGQANSEFL